MPFTSQLKSEYEKMYGDQKIRADKQSEISKIIATIQGGKARYETVSAATHTPWYIIGIIHHMECGSDFTCHLHNGDSLKARTHNEPSGRPVHGDPPFTWEESAIDALQFQGFDVWKDWGAGGTLYKLEAYNGFGSRNHGVPTPYLWAGTTYYIRGKYIKDGIWSPVAVSNQIGAAPILFTMNSKGLIQFPPSPPITPICETP